MMMMVMFGAFSNIVRVARMTVAMVTVWMLGNPNVVRTVSRVLAVGGTIIVVSVMAGIFWNPNVSVVVSSVIAMVAS